MEQQMTLGKRIAMLRKNQGWTQEQLGEKVGVSAQAVSKWENDQACPDISTLPLLADLFGVTTDELLGVKPIEPHVVILDKEPEENDQKGKGSFEFTVGDMDKNSGIMLCITAILVCVMLIVRSTTPLFNRDGIHVWNYIWPILVFGLGLLRVRKNPFFGVAAMLVGIYEFIWFGWGVPFEIQWYVILLVFAVAMLVKILLEKLGVIKGKDAHFVEFHGDNPHRVSEYSDDGEYLKADLAFGSNNIVYPYETLNGMDVDTSFGDHTIDLRNVKQFRNNPTLNVDVSFGNVVIYLPANVRLYKNSETAFSAFHIIGEPSVDAGQVAYLHGDVNFGNLEIRYPNV